MGAILTQPAQAAGNVIGAGASTDHAIPRWHGVDGRHLQNSGVILDDSDNMTGLGSLSLDGIVNQSVVRTDTSGIVAPSLCQAEFTGSLDNNLNNLGLRSYQVWNGTPNGFAVVQAGVYAESIASANANTLYGGIFAASLTAGITTVAYGLYVSVSQGAGVITTGYGLYISLVGAATGWAVYNASGKNWLLGTAAEVIQIRDPAITLGSLDDGHLDVTADISVDVNAPTLNARAVTLTASITLPADGTAWIGTGAAGVRLIPELAVTQWTVAGGDLMLGDAKRIYFEAAGTTKGTESIYSPSDGNLSVLAGTAITLGANVIIPDTKSLTLSDTIAAGDGVILKGTDRFIHNFHHPVGGGAVPMGYNTFVGVNAGNFTMGSTATSTSHGSTNSAMGVDALNANTLGYGNTAMGVQSLYMNSAGYYNSAIGANALRMNTTGYYNSAIGYNAGRFGADGIVLNETSFESVYLGAATKSSASGIQDEIVIGYGAIGQGIHTAVLGHTTIADSYIRGNLHVGQGAAGVDYTLTFDGETSDGVLTWMEDEDYFKFGSAVMMTGNITMGEDTWIGIGAAAERIVFDGSGDKIDIITGNTTATVTTGPAVTDPQLGVSNASATHPNYQIGFRIGQPGWYDSWGMICYAGGISMFFPGAGSIASNGTIYAGYSADQLVSCGTVRAGTAIGIGTNAYAGQPIRIIGTWAGYARGMFLNPILDSYDTDTPMGIQAACTVATEAGETFPWFAGIYSGDHAKTGAGTITYAAAIRAVEPSMGGTKNAAIGIYGPGKILFRDDDGTEQIWINSADDGYMDFVADTGIRATIGSTLALELTGAGSVVCGAQAALATNATSGFLYVPTCAGVPTGVPTAYTGKVAVVFDTTNHDLYFYDAAWIKVEPA